MNDYVASLIRTLVPVAVGWLVVALANIGVDVDQAATVAAVSSLVSGLYYALARWAESRWPALGWLLGLPKPPHY